jgi:amino acid transporter
MYNALLLSYSRIPAVLADDGFLPLAFAKTNARGVPAVSLAVCSVFYSMGLLFSFRKLIEIDLLFYGASLLLEFVALAVLRVREPNLPRPFRVPGGMVVAVLLGVPTSLLFAFGLAEELMNGESHTSSWVAAVASTAVGVLVWRFRRRPVPPVD